LLTLVIFRILLRPRTSKQYLVYRLVYPYHSLMSCGLDRGLSGWGLLLGGAGNMLLTTASSVALRQTLPAVQWKRRSLSSCVSGWCENLATYRGVLISP